MSPLEPHREDIVIVDSLSLKSFQEEHPGHGGHTALPYLLTGGQAAGGGDSYVGGKISLDQHIANVWQKKEPSPFASLVIGIDNKEETKPNHKYISFTGPAVGGSPAAPPVQDDPYKLFAKLFAGQAPGQPAAAQPDLLARIRAERRSMLDYLGKDLSRFCGALGGDDRQKCDAHITAIRSIEQQLAQKPPAGAASTGGPPAIEQGLSPYDKRVYDKLAKIQLDTVVAALAAGSTRVVTMLWNSSHNNVWVYYWLGADYSAPGRGEFNKLRNHHEISHHLGDPADYQRAIGIEKWFMGQMAYLIAELKKRPEGGGTMLDSSVLLWANCMQDGGAHSTSRMPFVLAGRAGGALKTGRWLRQSGTVPHNQMLVSLANHLDAPVDSFGPAKYGGALPNL
jgi:hypothetical protein